jgi:hypothetical protein
LYGLPRILNLSKLKQWFPPGFADGKLFRYAIGVYYEHWAKPNEGLQYRAREKEPNLYAEKIQKQNSDL